MTSQADISLGPHEADARTVELRKALQAKTALLHEVDHRVKNNLQLISSLILLQSRRTENEAARAALRGMLERIGAIATVHRRLFQSEDMEGFDVAAFMRDLTTDLMAAAGRRDIEAALDLERVDIPATQAAPLALVVNELIGNALKHAFADGRPGRIDISVSRRNGACDIAVRDNGCGLADYASPARGFGLTIVELLCHQLRATHAFENAQPGVWARLEIPVHAEGVAA